MFGLVPYGRKVFKSDLMDIRSVMDDFFNDGFFPGVLREGASIKADIKETEKEFIVEADLPGVSKDDISVELKEDVLSIVVERKMETKEEKDNYIRRERHYGSFSRSFYVQNVKNDAVNASFENGVLKVTLPKEDEVKPKKYSIDIN